ncbi:MAG: hypothetical protein FWE37_00070 [Spirochaetaceae bacterium]|nr:hypothetical protein [Spirochaetaceae bacterium]
MDTARILAIIVLGSFSISAIIGLTILIVFVIRKFGLLIGLIIGSPIIAFAILITIIISLGGV